MRVRLIFVPPGGGQSDYRLEFELPAIPQAGDYIYVTRDDEEGAECFIVRRTLWELSHRKAVTEDDDAGKASTIWVECEFARGRAMSDGHKQACDGYEAKGYTVQLQDPSAF
ncbi:MAG: alpha/beta hydrolase [Rhodobacteraceae bacterium]|nr:MAG: alpha/beta hydrolase [Paracoccaceae bacterium]